MAKSIQIRNVPERVHRTLRARAAEAGESLSDYLLHELEHLAGLPAVADVLRRAQERGGPDIPVDEIVAAVRSGRDRDE